MPGFIYGRAGISLTHSPEQVGEGKFTVASEEKLTELIMFNLAPMTCDQRRAYLNNFVVPTTAAGMKIAYARSNAPVNYMYHFAPIGGENHFGHGGTTGQLISRNMIPGDFYQQMAYYIADSLNGDYLRVEGDAMPATYLGPQDSIEFRVETLRNIITGLPIMAATVGATGEFVSAIDPDYFMSLFPECPVPGVLPNPGNGPAIILPSDPQHDDTMSVPPNRARVPLANHSMPLNILRFLK